MRSDLISRISPLKPFVAALLVASALACAPSGPAMAQEPGAEDLRALVYYLEHSDQRSVQAELRRLRAQFPRWTPPGDLNQLRAITETAQASIDERPIWALVEREDYAGARALIQQGQATVPGYIPNAELMRILETNESQAAFEAAYARRDLQAAITAVRRMPSLMRCDRINNAWRLAELYQAASEPDGAVGTYRGVVQSCTRPADVVPTLEKANDIASWPQMLELFDIARAASPPSIAQLDALQERLRSGRGAPRSAPVAASTGTARAAAPAAAAPSAPVAAAPSAPAPAEALPPAPTAPSVSYASLPLRGDSRLGQVRGFKERGDWASCLAASTSPRSLEVLYERSWCAYNLERTGEALAGFSATVQRANGLGGNVPRDSRFGLILSLLAMNMTEEGAGLAASTPLTQQQRIEVESTILDQRGVRAFINEEYAQSAAYFTALEQLVGSLRRDLAMLRGYAYLNNRQTDLALAEFQRLHSELATDETRAALAAVRSARSGG